MFKELKFVFHAPQTSGAYYETFTKSAYFFTLNLSGEKEKVFIKDIEQSITHETIHYAIEKVAGPKISVKFDRIAKSVYNYDRTLYNILY